MNKSKPEYRNSVSFIPMDKTIQESGVLLDLKYRSIPKIDNVFCFYKDFTESVFTVSVILEHSEKVFDILYTSNGSVEYNIIKKNDKYLHEMNYLLETVNHHFFGFFLLCNKKLTFRDKRFKAGEIINICFLPRERLHSEKEYRESNMLADIRFLGIKNVYLCPYNGQKVCVIYKKETKIKKIKDHFFIKEDQRFQTDNETNFLILNFEKVNVINFSIECETSDIESDIIFPERTKNKYNSNESCVIDMSAQEEIGRAHV